MLAVDSFDASTTSVHVSGVRGFMHHQSVSQDTSQLTCPEDVTGLERIILAAQGDLALLRLLR